jgi:hypothetical protein
VGRKGEASVFANALDEPVTASDTPAEVVKLTVPPRAAAACFARRRFSPLARVL